MSDKKELSENEKQLEFIQKAMKENHELRQVCLEMLRCLSHSDWSPNLNAHCKAELNRVLFNEGV
jgi:hypothetical protein